jgi:hypothetical protein
MHPHMLRHTFVTTRLDAGVSLRDVQIAARRADPRTTMRYDRARKNLDRHPNYILAAYMACGDVSGTSAYSKRAVSGAVSLVMSGMVVRSATARDVATPPARVHQ